MVGLVKINVWQYVYFESIIGLGKLLVGQCIGYMVGLGRIHIEECLKFKVGKRKVHGCNDEYSFLVIQIEV